MHFRLKSLNLSVNLSFCLSNYLPACLPVVLFLSASISKHLSIFLPVYFSVCLSSYMSVCIFLSKGHCTLSLKCSRAFFRFFVFLILSYQNACYGCENAENRTWSEFFYDGQKFRRQCANVIDTTWGRIYFLTCENFGHSVQWPWESVFWSAYLFINLMSFCLVFLPLSPSISVSLSIHLYSQQSTVCFAVYIYQYLYISI